MDHHRPNLVGSTVHLVSRDPRFRCGGRTIELNTSIESALSIKLKFVTFDLNRGHLDELELVIDCAARSVNRFL